MAKSFALSVVLQSAGFAWACVQAAKSESAVAVSYAAASIMGMAFAFVLVRVPAWRWTFLWLWAVPMVAAVSAYFRATGEMWLGVVVGIGLVVWAVVVVRSLDRASPHN